MTLEIGQHVQRKSNKQVVEVVGFKNVTGSIVLIRLWNRGITMEGGRYHDIEVDESELLPVYYKITYYKNIEQGGKIFHTPKDAREYAESRLKLNGITLEDLELNGFIFYEKVVLL